MAWVIGQSVINGILAGGVYALVAVGITIIFGVMKIVNFASGAYLVWGMYFTWIWHSITGVNAYLLIPCVVLSMALLGFLSFFAANMVYLYLTYLRMKRKSCLEEPVAPSCL